MTTTPFALGESLPRFELEPDGAPVRVVEQETWAKVLDEMAGRHAVAAE